MPSTAENSIEPSEDLAYWVGVIQSDGYLKKEKDNRYNGRIRYYAKVGVVKSIPMLRKFRSISKKTLGRTNTFWKNKKTGYIEFKIGINKLLPVFRKLDIKFSDPPEPPKWCLDNPSFFGAYLAGVIDGDGNITIKRPEYPQCSIRIFSGSEQRELKNSIEKMMKSKVHISKTTRLKTFRGRRFYGTCYTLETYASMKNAEFILSYVCRHIAMRYKRIKLKKFLEKRKAAAGIRFWTVYQGIQLPSLKAPQAYARICSMLPMCSIPNIFRSFLGFSKTFFTKKGLELHYSGHKTTIHHRLARLIMANSYLL